jgi:hypothetical protein
VALLLGLALAGITEPSEAAASSRPLSTAFVAGFGANTPSRVAKAAAVGVDTDILYEGPPSPTSRLGRALSNADMTVVDARISTELFFWECHRTHTVAPPPDDERNTYCARDDEPSVNSPEVVLNAVAGYLREDAANPLVGGYWILDDWAPWDGGSGRQLLREVRGEIEAATPGYPAICGFGGSIEELGVAGGFDPSTALNYSPGACSMVGLYDYTGSTRRPSSGEGYEWSLGLLLAEEQEDLASSGWRASEAPILGIGQAWSGRFEKREYEPGLSVEQMSAEAGAFCGAGASALGWYGWSDSGYTAATRTPNNSATIRRGIEDSIASCASL